jgi:hypothetical protein
VHNDQQAVNTKDFWTAIPYRKGNKENIAKNILLARRKKLNQLNLVQLHNGCVHNPAELLQNHFIASI